MAELRRDDSDVSHVSGISTEPSYASSFHNVTGSTDLNNRHALNMSVASFRQILDDDAPDFVLLNDRVFKTQHQQMQEQNKKLALYMHRNKHLDEDIKRLIAKLKLVEANRINQSSQHETEFMQIKTKERYIDDTKTEVKVKKTNIRSLEIINENLEGDIANLDDRIDYLHRKMAAVKKSLAKAMAAVQHDEDQVKMLEPEKEALEKERDQQRRKHEKEMVRLMAARRHRPADSDYVPEQMSQEDISKILKELRLKYIRQIENNPEFIKGRDHNKELTVRIVQQEKMAKDLQKEIDNNKKLLGKMEDRVNDGQHELDMLKFKIKQSLSALEKQREYITASLERIDSELFRLEMQKEVLTAQQQEAMGQLLQFTAKREKLEPELVKMGGMIRLQQNRRLSHASNRSGVRV